VLTIEASNMLSSEESAATQAVVFFMLRSVRREGWLTQAR